MDAPCKFLCVLFLGVSVIIGSHKSLSESSTELLLKSFARDEQDYAVCIDVHFCANRSQNISEDVTNVDEVSLAVEVNKSYGYTYYEYDLFRGNFISLCVNQSNVHSFRLIPEI